MFDRFCLLALLLQPSLPVIARRVIIALGPASSLITGFDIDTAHFTGNYGPEANVWGLTCDPKEEEGLDGDDPRVRPPFPFFPSFH